MTPRSSCVILGLLVFVHFEGSLQKIFPGKCPEHNAYINYLTPYVFNLDWYILAVLPELMSNTSFFVDPKCWFIAQEHDITITCKYLGIIYRNNFCGRLLLRYCFDPSDYMSDRHNWYHLDKNISLGKEHTLFECHDEINWTNWFVFLDMDMVHQYKDDEISATVEGFMIIWGCKNIDEFNHNEGALILTRNILNEPSPLLVKSLMYKYLDFTEISLSDLIITEHFNIQENMCLDDYICPKYRDYNCNVHFLAERAAFQPKQGKVKEAATVKAKGGISVKTILLYIFIFVLFMIIVYKVGLSKCLRKRQNQVVAQEN